MIAVFKPVYLWQCKSPYNVSSFIFFEIPWSYYDNVIVAYPEYPKILRRDPDKILQYLAKEFAVPAQLLGEKAMFIGKRDPDDFTRLFGIYIKDYVKCSTCGSPDTKIEKENRIPFLICEACGAKSTMKGKYA